MRPHAHAAVRIAAPALFFAAGFLGQTRGVPSSVWTTRPPAITLPPSLVDERAAYEGDVCRAMDEVGRFFRACGLGPAGGRLVDSVTVFGSPAEARERIAKLYGIPASGIPETFAGTVDGRMLFLISRESYAEIWRSLYPEWPWAGTAYHALIVHELAHRAHEAIAVARHGTPDAMGPAWFFEGLAVVCAGQFRKVEPPMSLEEVVKAAGLRGRPGPAYPLYGRMVRSLVLLCSVSDLIDRAAEPGFPAGLASKAVSPGAPDR